MISKEETEHIAKLARLDLAPTEIARYQKDLSAILDYIEKLKEVDIEGVKPFTHSVEMFNVLRSDIAITRDKKEVEKLRAQMPQVKDDYLKVKPIF